MPDITTRKNLKLATKRSVLWLSKYPKMRFLPGLCPNPAGGAHDTPPDLLVGWGGDTHPRTPPSVPAMCPPEFQPDIAHDCMLLQNY